MSASTSSSPSLPSVVIYRNNVRMSERVAAVILQEYHNFQLIGCDTNEIKDVLPSSIQLAVIFGSYFSIEAVESVTQKSAAVEIYRFAGNLDKYGDAADNVVFLEFKEGESLVSDRIIKLYAPGFVPKNDDVKVFLACVHQHAVGQKMEPPVKAVIEFMTHGVNDEFIRSAINGTIKIKGDEDERQYCVATTESVGKDIASKAGHYHCFGYNVRMVDCASLVKTVANAMCADGVDISIISRLDHLSKKYRYTMQTQRNDIDLLSFREKYKFKRDFGGCSKQIGFLHDLDPRSFVEEFDTKCLVWY